MGGNKEFFFLKILKETNIWKNYPACKELNMKVVPSNTFEFGSKGVNTRDGFIWTQRHWAEIIWTAPLNIN